MSAERIDRKEIACQYGASPDVLERLEMEDIPLVRCRIKTDYDGFKILVYHHGFGSSERSPSRWLTSRPYAVWVHGREHLRNAVGAIRTFKTYRRAVKAGQRAVAGVLEPWEKPVAERKKQVSAAALARGLEADHKVRKA